MLKLNLPGRPENLFRDGRLPRLVGVTLVEDEPNWTHPMHAHDDTSDMVLITKGTGSLFSMNRSFKTQIGDLTVYNRGLLHGELSSYDDPIEFIALHMMDVAIKGLEDGCIIPTNALPHIKTGDLFSPMLMLFNLLLRETTECKLGYETTCQHILLVILSLVHRLMENNSEYNEGTEKNDTSTISERIMKYLDTNYKNWITLDDLEEKFHFNRYYIAHVFKMETGFSPNQYIINRRIGEAQRLLLSTDISANEISNIVGYKNVNQFYSVFKKYKGVSPIRFRQSNSRTYT